MIVLCCSQTRCRVSSSLKEPIIQLNDFTLTLGRQDYIPLLVGGMGVDVSTPNLVLAVAHLGGIAHLSDAMLPAVLNRHAGTCFVQDKRAQCQVIAHPETAATAFDVTALREATHRYIRSVMNRKRGDGGVFLNVMEKLGMGNPRVTLAARLTAAMDAGIDGITLSAGLHLGTLELLKTHARFRDIKLGIIVSSARALKLFLLRAAKAGRMPDYIIVEGPLAGGHLGFSCTWHDFNLATIVGEVQRLLAQETLCIPVIPAGGIFTGSDAVNFLRQGAVPRYRWPRALPSPRRAACQRLKQASRGPGAMMLKSICSRRRAIPCAC